jgi:hypothetical protein
VVKPPSRRNARPVVAAYLFSSQREGATLKGNMAELQEAFDRHFKETHLRKDASQAPAWIVRESTEAD